MDGLLKTKFNTLKVLGNGKSFTGTASADSIAGYDGSGTLNIPKIYYKVKKIWNDFRKTY